MSIRKKTNKGHSSYGPELLDIARRMAKQYATKNEIAAAMGITRRTLTTWRKKYPELDDVISNGHIPDPADVDAKVAELQEKQRLANEWILEYLKTRGKVTIERTGDNEGSFTEVRMGYTPSRWIIERILDADKATREAFEITINVAEPN